MAHRRSTRGRRRRRSSRRSGPSLPKLELPQLEQRHYDLIGLGLVAFAAFFACVFYLGWAGGEVGEAMADGFLALFGGAGYLVPVALFGTGAVLVLRPMLPAVRPFRTGALCLAAALCLGLAAGSLGLGPGDTARAGTLDSEYLRTHGGLVGEGLFYVTRTLFQEVGAHLLFGFLALAGVLLLTGASVAGLVKGTRESVASTTRRVRQSTGELASGLRTERTRPIAPEPQAEIEPEEDEGPPEVEPVVRATHVEVPSTEDAPDDYVAPEEPPDGFDFDGEPEDEALEPDPPEPESRQPVQEELTPMGKRRSPVTESDDLAYHLPRDGFLTRSGAGPKTDVKGIERAGRQVVEALAHFAVEAQVTGTVSGPHVTRYELRLAPGVKMSKVANLKDDLAYAMAAEHVRILAPIPGKQAVGVEVPNRVRKMVHLGDVLQEAPAKWSPLTVWLGKDIGGKSIGTDLAKQPHVLVAGTTGSGKSGSVNAMLSSILLRATPNEVRLVLVDPKRVELNHYEHIPHLLTPVITSPRLAANALANLIKEMEERYDVMSAARTRNLEELNRARVRDGERPLPYILCVIDELADLMMIAPGEVEDSIIRLAQKSRAVGIHLLLATQRPSADVITGMIKANVPARIAFAV
ncbi:MAG: DNA translocase FtsK 4TM domain-containing protein, partial [Actinomycetota bacterium]|nr:DNA translocase FtsK 4TM domain-containing protein [Actinomycetota bacterium]